MTFFSNPKRKSYVLNPRGTALYEDTNRFGTKMLEKMGWSKGKGLGVDLNGEQEFVKVSYKLDQKGLGFTDRDDQWTQHEDQFNSLLKSFDDNSSKSNSNTNSGDDNDDKEQTLGSRTSGKSLEELSKKSRARVHYKKFTRGKDMTRYNDKELANIFGRRTLDEKLPTEINDDEPAESVSKSECDDKVVPNFGITTIETGVSVNDYFKKKLSILRGGGDQSENVPTELATVDETAVLPKKKSKKSKHIEVPIDDEVILPEKEKKKKRKEKSEVSVVADDVVCKDFVEVETKKKKKKNKTKDSINDVEILAIQKEEIVKEIQIPLEKSKKRKVDSVEEAVSTINDQHEPSSSSTMKKKKKKKKSSEASELEVSKLVDSLVYTMSTINRNVDENATAENNDNHNADHLQSIYDINSYKLEIFKFLNLNDFSNSSLANIAGYGYRNDLKLNIIESLRDAKRINNFWDQALMHKYGENVIKKQHRDRFNIKKLKKKNVFKSKF